MTGEQNEDKKIDKTLLDRTFQQIDKNTSNIHELTGIVGQNSSSISILKKILIGILLFIIVTALTTFFVDIKELKEIKKINNLNDKTVIGKFVGEENKTNEKNN